VQKLPGELAMTITVELDYRKVLDAYGYNRATDRFFLINSQEENWESRSSKRREQSENIALNAYERDLHARHACIEHYRKEAGGNVICWVCNFDFGEIYDPRMAGKIHVHHRKLLSEIKGEYHVDPINDLIPVCPNCHYALHFLDYSPESLRERFRQDKQLQKQ
jgi:5-methylcytosine-specific restriction protein A